MKVSRLIELLKPYEDMDVTFHHFNTGLEVATVRAEVHPKMLQVVDIQLIDTHFLIKKVVVPEA